MLSSFEHFFKVLWAQPHVWLAWIAVTAAAVVFTALQVGPALAPSSRGAKERPINLIACLRALGMAKALAGLALLAVFLGFYIALILAWEDFDYYDNDMFTLFTLKGRNIGIQIGNGRFFPFGHQEFNVIRHFTHTAIGYQALPIAQLLIFFCTVVALDSELNIVARAVLAILALLTPSILISFSSLIVPERNVLFFLAFFALSMGRFEQTQSKAWAVAAVVCAQFMIFYKETAFLLILGFAAARLILRVLNDNGEGRDHHRLWDKEGRLDLCLALLAGLFLLEYFGVARISGKANYDTEHGRPLAEIALSYLRLDLLAWLLAALAIGRSYLILRRRAAPSLLWDGLALGGVACFLGYFSLRLYSSYYLAPVDLIAVLYVGRFAILSWEKTRSRTKLAALLIGSAVLVQDVAFSAFAIYERKNVIRAKAEIASVVKARSAGGALTLFFPFASPYVIDQFAAYLEYRGVHAEGGANEASGPYEVVLATKAPAAHDWRCAWCRAANGPAPGDLVIVLPDDEASLGEASAYRKGGELLFSYHPRPAIPQWLYSLVGNQPLVTAKYSAASRPDRWMDGSVTAWR
jgi:hypothetical protein